MRSSRWLRDTSGSATRWRWAGSTPSHTRPTKKRPRNGTSIGSRSGSRIRRRGPPFSAGVGGTFAVYVAAGSSLETLTGEPLEEGIAAADARLGRRFPLPAVALPLARWVEIRGAGPTGAEVEWNLDDSRPGSPGRVALYAGLEAPVDQLPADAPERPVSAGGRRIILREAPLAAAQESLRPVLELHWRAGDLHLRLTAQGPWRLEDLLRIVASIEA